MGCKKITYYEEEGFKEKSFLKVVGSEKRETEHFFGIDYYPYGKILREWNPQTEKYLTTHHERDTETGLDYRGARYYDSDNSRLLSLDPLQAEYPSWSPYCYVAGNPIILVDPDGRDWGDFLDGLKDKAQSYAVEKVNQLANAITESTVKYVDNKYQELKQALEESGNTEIKLTGKVNVPLGIFGAVGGEVLKNGENIDLNVLSTNILGYEAGVKIDKSGFSIVNEAEYPGNGKGTTLTSGISATYGLLNANAQNELTVTGLSGNYSDVKDSKQTAGFGIGGSAGIGVKKDYTNNRVIKETKVEGGLGIGIGLKGSIGLEISSDATKK